MSRYTHQAIDRLGFDSWCADLMADQIENMTTPKGVFIHEEDGMSYNISWGDNKGVASFRAHTSTGWQETTLQFNLRNNA